MKKFLIIVILGMWPLLLLTEYVFDVKPANAQMSPSAFEHRFLKAQEDQVKNTDKIHTELVKIRKLLEKK